MILGQFCGICFYRFFMAFLWCRSFFYRFLMFFQGFSIVFFVPLASRRSKDPKEQRRNNFKHQHHPTPLAQKNRKTKKKTETTEKQGQKPTTKQVRNPLSSPCRKVIETLERRKIKLARGRFVGGVPVILFSVFIFVFFFCGGGGVYGCFLWVLLFYLFVCFCLFSIC